MAAAIRSDAYELAPVQQGMLFHWLLDRHSGTDIEQVVLDLHEPVDLARLAEAWQHAVNTFEALRTSFRWEGVTPKQRVERSAKIPVAIEDLRALSPEARETRVREYLATDRHDGFDFAHAPLTRVTLFQFDETHVRLVWTIHHILIDGRAFEVILNTVFAEYEGTVAPVVSHRPYRDYIEWVAQQDPSEARAFWRDYLRGFLAPTPLPPGDLEHGEGKGWAQTSAELSLELTSGLRGLAEREGLSLNTLVMSAWAFLLSRYSGESEVVFGATKTTRGGTIEGADSIVGLFLATIPVRVRIDPAVSVAEWLRTVREEWLALRGQEHLPLVEIKHESEIPAGAPLFDSLFVFERYRLGPRLRSQGGAWANRQVRVHEQTSYPLTLKAYDGAALTFRLDYDDRRYTQETADHFIALLTEVFTAWCADATMPLGATPFLSRQDYGTLVSVWNATAKPYPRETSLAEIVEGHATRTPERVAVQMDDVMLTYAELNQRANRLSHTLSAQGIGPDALVGVCVRRSPNMLAALLAVSKAGAAYVPLDPGFPSERLGFMAQDAGLRALISEPELEGAVPGFTGTVLHLTDETWQSGDTSNPPVTAGPDHLAYVLYTSGSTGKPKGVEITRGAFLNFLEAMRETPGIAPDDSLLAVTTISFDIAGMELFLPLVAGARIVLASRETAADGYALRALLETSGITIMQATPVTWRLLLECGWRNGEGLTIITGGEALSRQLADALLATGGTVWNLYGPTETTVWSTAERIEADEQPITIGRAVANTNIYILDPQTLQPLPAGVAGELFIGGHGVARGYHNRPDLTEERFIRDPFPCALGDRMYRTGDLARFLPDGRIVHLGRGDHQVKIRGFRIELGEIESVLKTHDSVRDVVVVAREDIPGDPRLVAYIVARDAVTDPAELRAHLRETLPDYMIPALFVSLDALPLTGSGKIDRKALPAPEAGSIGVEHSIVPPRTYVEKQLSEIWEETFGLPRVSVTADFFDLGGHSILAVALMAKIAQVFGKQLPLNALFESPTIETLAKHIEDDSRTVGAHTLVTIQASGTRPPIYWIPGGAALGLFSLRHVVTRLGPDQPVYGLGSSLPESLDAIETVEERAANYLALIRKFQPHGPYCFAGFCAGGIVAYEIAQQLRAAGETVAFLGMINCSFPNYPTGRINAFRTRTQRLRYQIRTARDQGLSLLGYVREKIESRRVAQTERANLEAARETVREHGFQQGETIQKQVLLDATVAVFDRYQPRLYPGTISLFISDDEAMAGVTPSLDPRYAWRRRAAEDLLYTFPGGHEAVLEMPYAIDFADTLQKALEHSLRDITARRATPETSAHPTANARDYSRRADARSMRS